MGEPGSGNMILCEPQAVTSSQLGELDAAWCNAIARVPLATSRVTVLNPYAHDHLAAEYNWTAHGLNSVDLGVPGLGTGSEPVSGEHAQVFRPLDHAYDPARLAYPRTPSQKLADRLAGGRGAALAARQWTVLPPGMHNLQAFLVHERAHGQAREARLFISGFEEKMFAAVAGALGVAGIGHTPQTPARSRAGKREMAHSAGMQLEIRKAVADEFGLYAATFPAPSHPWGELWPSFVTMMEYLPGRAGRISRALQPLQEEIAAIPAESQRLYLYSRLDARFMLPLVLDILRREQFDLYVIAIARSGRVSPRTAADLLAEARERGAELDTAYLKTATSMGDFMPALHGPAPQIDFTPATPHPAVVNMPRPLHSTSPSRSSKATKPAPGVDPPPPGMAPPIADDAVLPDSGGTHLQSGHYDFPISSPLGGGVPGAARPQRSRPRRALRANSEPKQHRRQP